jgi:hypothetical protein
MTKNKNYSDQIKIMTSQLPDDSSDYRQINIAKSLIKTLLMITAIVIFLAVGGYLLLSNMHWTIS